MDKSFKVYYYTMSIATAILCIISIVFAIICFYDGYTANGISLSLSAVVFLLNFISIQIQKSTNRIQNKTIQILNKRNQLLEEQKEILAAQRKNIEIKPEENE